MDTEIGAFNHHFTGADYTIMVVYLGILVSLGFLLKKLVGGTADYFVGGRRVSWWLVGISAFMMSFSAWTFTGAAGFAYEYGVVAIYMFFGGNALAYLFVALFLSQKIRQTRCVTYMQIVYQRYGRTTEQMITWLKVPMFVSGGAIWLTGFSIFMSVAFNMPMNITVVLAGAIIITYATLGGSWAVTATDFFQGIILLVIIVTVAVLTYFKIGGASGIAENIEPHLFVGFRGERDGYWLFAYILVLFLSSTSVQGAQKYLAVKDGASARKVALVAAGLFLIGPVIWFFPPMAATYFYPDIASVLPQLNHPQEGAYLIMGLDVLPPGVAALLLLVIFGATLSSMDSSLTQSSAVLTMNFYNPVIRPDATDRELFIVARFFNLALGLIVVSLALIVANMETHGLFELNIIIQSVAGAPLAIPLFLLFFVRKAPPQAAVYSLLVGLCASAILNQSNLFPEFRYSITDAVFRWWGAEDMVGAPLSLFWRNTLVVSAGAITYFLSMPLWKKLTPEKQAGIKEFYRRMDTPIDVEAEVTGGEDLRQFAIVGSVLMIMGSVVTATTFFATDGEWKINLIVGLAIFLIGLFFFRLGIHHLKKRQSLANKANTSP